MQHLIPGLRQAVDNLLAAIRKTEAEIVQLKETLNSKKNEVKTWRTNVARITGEKPLEVGKSGKNMVEA